MVSGKDTPLREPVKLGLDDTLGWVRKPEVLQQPHIPKPLHGIAPRVVKGKEWWDKVREDAYRSTNYHCVACGVPKENALKHKWLEAHENWNIDGTTGSCEVLSIVPLCHYCHNFIHSGRLHTRMRMSEVTVKEVTQVLEHGFKILSENGLGAFFYTHNMARQLGANTYGVEPYPFFISSKIKWEDFHMVLEGKRYYSKFKTNKEWEIHYEN